MSVAVIAVAHEGHAAATSISRPMIPDQLLKKIEFEQKFTSSSKQ